MLPMLTATHPIFALPSERSRSYLQWAQRLAQVEGVILLMGAWMMIYRSGVAHTSRLAVGALLLSLMSLTLAWQVGRGSARAAMILLGLSVSRGVMTLAPGGPDWWTTFPPLTMLELFVFAQGARGAIALTQHHVATAVKAPVVVNTMGTKVYGNHPAPRAGIWPRQFFV